MTESLRHAPSDYIDGSFIPLAGDAILSTNPAQPGQVIWRAAPQPSHVDRAVAAARAAAPAWAGCSRDERIEVLRRWQSVTTANVDRIAGLICDEMGKTMAESLFEAKALAGKVDITLNDRSLARIGDYQVSVNETRDGWCYFRPHGVMAVIGPFNFPAHLPNGHFVPAMLLGNTIVLKPSEKTPAVGQLLAELMDEADVPKGVFNVVQGDGPLAASLCNHDDVDGILFTGSWPVGRRILEANLDRPGRIVALEMGGNNPSVVCSDAHLTQAVVECARAAFATTGQRCTCTRRIIVEDAIADRFLAALARVTSTLIIGPGREEGPVFMGPVISADAADDVLRFQEELLQRGGRVIAPAERPDTPGHFVTPAIVEVDGFSREHDEEVFGPLVQVTRVPNLDAAIEQANATRYGLASSIFTASETSFRTFYERNRAGCINWNTGTAGASSLLPFGGLGHSGNHRPAAAFSVDYCAYPVASMQEHGNGVAVPAGMSIEAAGLD